MPTYPASKPTRTPLQQAARTANIWGWSYILTFLGIFGAWSVPPGPLRVLLLNLGILCTIIGVLELVWRHQLLKTKEARWAKTLALNQVAGTLSLLWSLYLLYQVPEQILMDYSKKSDLWNSVQPLLRSMDSSHILTDAFILRVWHITKLIGVYGLGGALVLSQIWVIAHYWQQATAIALTPPPSEVPPVLQK
jgi:hypothetical protein